MILSPLNLCGQKFRMGIGGGFDVANARMTDKPKINFTSRVYYPMVAFNINGFFHYTIRDKISFSVEPGFIRKGGMQKDTYNSADAMNIKFRLNYLQMPFLIEYSLGDHIYILVGPEVSYLLNATAKGMDIKNDITDNYDNLYEISGNIGFGFIITPYLQTGIRYNHGFTATQTLYWTDSDGRATGVSKEFNQYIQLFVRLYIFPQSI